MSILQKQPRGPATPAKTGRARGAGLWTLQALTAAGFLASAAAKFTGAERIEEVFTAMGAGHTLMYTVAVLEVAGAVGLLIPRLCGVAATAFVALTAGALATHAVVGGAALPAAVMFCLAGFLAWARRHDTVALVKPLTTPRRPGTGHQTRQHHASERP